MTYALKLICGRNALRHIADAVFIYEKIERKYALCLTARESGVFVVFVEHLFAELYSFVFIKIGTVGYAVERKAAVEVFHCDITSSIVYILPNCGGKQRQLFTSPFEMFIV